MLFRLRPNVLFRCFMVLWNISTVGRSTLDMAKIALDKRWEQGVGKSILGIEAPTFDIYLERVLETKTSLDRISLLLTDIQSGNPIDFTHGSFAAANEYSRTVAEDLQHLIANGSPSRHFVQRHDDYSDYSCCHYRFAKNARSHYLAHRIAKCPRCGKFNLRLKP